MESRHVLNRVANTIKETRLLYVPVDARDCYWSNLSLLISRLQESVERLSDAAAFKSSSKQSFVARAVDTGDGLRSAGPRARPPEDGECPSGSVSLNDSNPSSAHSQGKNSRRKQPPNDELLFWSLDSVVQF